MNGGRMNAAWSSFRSALRRLFAAAAAERRLDAEVRSYLQHDVDARIAAGLTPEAARRAARRDLGGVEQVKEGVRSGRAGAGIESVLRDVGYAGRTLRASPGFSLAVIASLGLGIAATVATFSFINAAMFRPFPGVRVQDELVRLRVATPVSVGSPSGGPVIDRIASTYDEYRVLASGVPGLAGLSAHYVVDVFTVAIEGEPMAVSGALVSGNYFDVLGVQPAAGRFFAPTDDDLGAGGQPVAVIGYQLWERHFASDRGVIGRAIDVNGVPLQIIGVAPANFSGVRMDAYHAQLWAPLARGEIALRDRQGRAVGVQAAGEIAFDYVGRRRPGVTLDQIRVQTETVGQWLAEGREERPAATRVTALPVRLNDPAQNWPAIAALMAVAGIVLAVACINAANLLLARSSRRADEWTLRLALGATRPRLTRQLLTESALLAFAATAVGLLLTAWALRIVEGVFPVPIVIDAHVLTFTIAVTMTSVLLFGLGPAWSVAAKSAARAPASPRSSAGPVASKLRLALIATQAAFSVGLLATGWQFVRTTQAGGPADVAELDRLVIASFDIGALGYPATAADDFYEQLIEQAAGLPGVRAAGVSHRRYMGSLDQGAFSPIALLDGDADSRHMAVYAGGELMSILGLEVIQGTGFSAEDFVGRPRSVLVNPAFAAQVLGGQPIGRALRLAPAPALGQERAEPGAEAASDVIVIGVAAAPPGSRVDARPLLYYPAPLEHQPARHLHLRLDRPAADVMPALRAAVRRLNARLPILEVRTAQDILASGRSEDRWFAHFVAALGLLALALASAGLYGIASYMVTLRKREIGIRLTLGGDAGAILRLILRQALTPVVIGCALGLAGAMAAGVIIRARLYGAAPVDPIAFSGAAGLVLAILLLASLIPARAATRVDPASILRDE